MDLTASVGVRVAPSEVPGAVQRLTEQLAADPTPEVHVALGLMLYLFADFGPAARHMEEAYLAYRADGSPRRAALAASHLARIYQDGIGAEPVASGWLARAERLLDGEDDCVERGWVALPLTGCNIPDAEDLRRRTALALTIARQFDDVDLECKALADGGMALVAFGEVEEGMRHIDEAMAMATSGECANAFITAQIRCCLVSACERTGALARLAGWLAATTAEEPELLGADAPPNLLLSHCHSGYGLLLCQAGRWDEAEVALQRAATSGESIHFHSKAQTRAALAALRLEQGRLAEAGQLLEGLEHRWEAQHSLVRLHLLRGDADLAAGAARLALRTFAGDRVRTVPLLAVLVEAELARGNDAEAAEAAERLRACAEAVGQARLGATAARAQALVALAAGRVEEAVARLEDGLRLLREEEWPLLAADLHLDLARALREADPSAAVTEARRALATFGRVGAYRVRAAQDLLHELGASDAPAGVPVPLQGLTPREREILPLLAEGLSNPQIAHRLVISPKTAEHHVGAILRKLGMSNRSEAAVYAVTTGRT